MPETNRLRVYERSFRMVFGLMAVVALLGAEVRNSIDAYLASYISQAEFSGVIYIVGKSGDVYRGASGKVSSFDTTFAIGSVSKTFNAAAIELLAGQGKLRYSNSLKALIPEYSHSKDVTIDELLNHTVGIPDFYSIRTFAAVREQNLPLPEIARWLSRYPLDFKPGSKGRYSNSGYVLLALATERASGKPYAALLRENIFTPFGLTHTSGEPPSES